MSVLYYVYCYNGCAKTHCFIQKQQEDYVINVKNFKRRIAEITHPLGETWMCHNIAI